MGYKGITEDEQKTVALFLDDCSILDINQGIKNIVIGLRKKYTLKMPDAIVVATAIFLGIPIVTADKKLDKISEATIVLYQP